MRLVLVAALLASGCTRQFLRADAAPTADFPATWSGRVEPQRLETPPAPAPIREAPPAARTSRTGLLAVLEFNNKLKGSDRESLDSAYFANQVRAAAKRIAPALRVMTRENVLVLLQSSGKALEECLGECEVETGRKLGADLVVSGDVLKVGTNYKIDLRMHDTREGQLMSGAAASGHSADELDTNLASAVDNLLAALR